MKTSNRNIAVLLSLAVLAGCTPPKSDPRAPHETAAPEWKERKTPVNPAIDDSAYRTLDLVKTRASLEAARLNPKLDAAEGTLQPLADIVLNAKFIGDPKYRGPRLWEMVQLFHRGFLPMIEGKSQSASFAKLKDQYYDTVFAGCTRDLRRDCSNVALFSSEALFPRIMTAFATELDSKIEAELKAGDGGAKTCVVKSAACRGFVEERYRRLAMAMHNQRNQSGGSEFSFAYLKYARMYALLLEHTKTLVAEGKSVGEGDVSFAYLAETHGKIFETMIAKFKPKSIADKDFQAFVENFNPWVFSRKESDLFQYGTRIMFELGAQCCLYADSTRKKLSPSVARAIEDAQKSEDSFVTPSFRKMIEEIRKDHGDRLFEKHNLSEIVAKADKPESGFYGEYFFVVDRLFRGHLSSAETEMVLRVVESSRAAKELPAMVSAYIRIYLLYMVVDTNRFMRKLYTGGDVSSNEVFAAALTRSRELTSRWHTIQAQIDLLDRMLGSYFRGRNMSSQEYVKAVRDVEAVNKNIHYFSVFPQMIVMNYFLAKMNGAIVVNSWWGRISIDAATILQAFLDGDIPSAWFRFGKDTEAASREMLLFAIEYLLSTETLDSFVAKDRVNGANDGGSDRALFLDLLFSKYLEGNVREIGNKVTEYERQTLSNPGFAFINEICEYETKDSAAGSLAPRLEVNFVELNRFTYTGLGNNGVNAILNKLLGEGGNPAGYMRGKADGRITYVKTIIEIIEADLLKNGKIKKAGDKHPDTEKARELLARLEGFKVQLAKMYTSVHKRYFDCLTRLQDVERRRANRLYEEERAHLGRIYDLMEPLGKLSDEASLNAAVKKLNDEYFRNPANGYRFDRVEGLSYRLSKYDLLMRMKKRVESDLFAQPSEIERRVYGSSIARYVRPRSVNVYMPSGIEREDMVTQGTNVPLYFRGDREEFIRQGMGAMNGKTGSFIEWQGQMNADKDGGLAYIRSLMEFYLLGPVKDGEKTYEITKEDLAKGYIEVIASSTLDEIDRGNVRAFGIDGRYDKSYFEGLIFEKNGQSRLPFFYWPMLLATEFGRLDAGEASPGFEALGFAQAMNQVANDPGMFLFQPSGRVQSSVREVYGSRVNSAYARIAELYQHFKSLEETKPDIASYDPRLAQPHYFDAGTPVTWRVEGDAKAIYDPRRAENLRFSLSNFIQRTGDFYGTKEKVKAP